MATDTFRSAGFSGIRRSDEVQTAQDAAEVFAGRLARRVYGRKGYCRTVRVDSWTQDGRNHTFEVFIGVDGPNGMTGGRNEWIYVTVD